MKSISLFSIALCCVITASEGQGHLQEFNPHNVQSQLSELLERYTGPKDQTEQNEILHQSILKKSFGQVARSLLSGADPSSIVDGGSAVQKVLHSWDRELFEKWPLDDTEGHRRTFDILRDLDADVMTNCPITQAARLRNEYALSSLVQNEQITREHVEACLLENFEINGFNLLHFSASSPAPGIARLFFRGGKNGVQDGDDASQRLFREMSVKYQSRMWPIGMKNDHEASASPVELEALIPYLLPQGRKLRYGQLSQGADPSLDATYNIDPGSERILPLLQHIDGVTGTNPLVRACLNGRAETVQLIIDIFPAPVARYAAFGGFAHSYAHGMGCAHYAARAGYKQIIKILYESLGRDLLITRDVFGRTACEIALGFGKIHKELIEYMVSIDACPPPFDYETDAAEEDTPEFSRYVDVEKKLGLLPKPIHGAEYCVPDFFFGPQNEKEKALFELGSMHSDHFDATSMRQPQRQYAYLDTQSGSTVPGSIDTNAEEDSEHSKHELSSRHAVQQMIARYKREKRWRAEVMERMNRCPIPRHFHNAPEPLDPSIDIGALRSSQLPELSGFNAHLHVLAGWRLLSPERLASLGLPSNLLERGALNRGQNVNIAENFKEACTVDELPLSALRRVKRSGGILQDLLSDLTSDRTNGYLDEEGYSGEYFDSGDDEEEYFEEEGYGHDFHFNMDRGDNSSGNEDSEKRNSHFHETVYNEGHFYDYDGEMFLEAPIELVRDHFSLAKPFIVRGAYDVTTMELLMEDSGQDHGHNEEFFEQKRRERLPHRTGYKSYSRMQEEFGNLWVEAGALPYATAYGGKTNPIYAGQFIESYMGNNLADHLKTPFETMNLLREIEDPTYVEGYPIFTAKGEEFSYSNPLHDSPSVHKLHPNRNGDRVLREKSPTIHPQMRLAQHILDSGAAYGGAGDDFMPLPYIFDGSIIDAGPGVPIVSNFTFPKVFSKDDSHRQFAMGSSLTGAMPHFHGAAANAVFFGVKLWVLTPPEYASFTDSPAAEWWREFYLPAHGDVHWKGHKDAQVFPHYLLLQGPGDLVYVPHHYGHAVINLADTFAFAYE